MRSATSKTTSMLCVITTMPSPWSRSLPDELEHLRGLATPSAAVGSSRITSLASQSVARATATACRWPPDSELTRLRRLSIVVTWRSRMRSDACSSISVLGEDPHRVRERPRLGELTAEVEVRDDVEVVAQRQILVDGLDPEPVGVARVADRHLPALEAVAPAVGGLRAGDGLDQRGLAGAVVAHERDDLARVDLEVDVGERLDGAEALRDPDALEQRRRAQWRTSVGGLGSGRDGHGNTVPHGARARIGARPRAACARIPAPHP